MLKQDDASTRLILERLSILEDNLNQFFLSFSGIVITVLQVGFACLEAGAVLPQNVHTIMLKNFLDTFVSCVAYWICGYGLAYSEGNLFIGLEWWASYKMPPEEWPRWFHQITFASTASTVISGAVAERCSFKAYIVYSFLMTGFIYPVVCHWVWSDRGWLNELGFVDFAGGAVIHAVAGSASLMAAAWLGPRKGRFEYPKEFAQRKLSSPALIGTGGLLLLTGFIGFNSGSLSHITDKGDGIILAQIMCNTVSGGAGGSILTLFASRCGLVGKKCWNLGNTVNGGVAGIVSVCAGCNIFTVAEAFIVGAIGGIIFIILHHAIIAMKIDDPLDAAPVHLGGGLWSPISVPLLSNRNILSGWSNVSNKFFISCTGVGCIILWSLVMSFFLFGILKLLGIFSVTKEEEPAAASTPEFSSNFVQITKQPNPYYRSEGLHNIQLASISASSLNTRVYTVL